MIIRLAALTGAAAALAVALAGPAAASSLPKDPSTTGYLGFCDATHHQVRAGQLGAAPFAWTTVASTAAPEGYAKGKAAIYAYQPRPGTEPDEWSGKQLTASSTFTNARHPMSSGTRVDPALVDFTATFPPQQQGLVQLRMVLTAYNRPQYVRGYSAVFIRVTGTRWTQVDGGAVDCRAGSARSVELDALSASRLKIRNPRPAPQSAEQISRQQQAAVPTSSAPASSGAAASGSAGTSAPSSPGTRPVAEQQSADGGDSSALIWFTVAGVVLLGGGGVMALRRTRSAK